jgi:hypothetical protein
MHRYRTMGQRLAGITYQRWDMYGWFAWSRDSPLVVRLAVVGHMEIALPFTAEFMEPKLDNLILVNKHDLDSACLSDPTTGFSQTLNPLLDVQHPNHGHVKDAAGFEYPDAAVQFRNVELPDGWEGVMETHRGYRRPVAPAGGAVGNGAGLPAPLGNVAGLHNLNAMVAGAGGGAAAGAAHLLPVPPMPLAGVLPAF